MKEHDYDNEELILTEDVPNNKSVALRIDDIDNPPLSTTEITVPDIIDLTGTSSLEDAKKADLPLANTILQFVHVAWGEVRTIGMLGKMVDITVKAVKHRRDVLGLHYGAKNTEQKSDMVFPVP